MTRTDSVRHAAAITKGNVRYATQMVAPYAGTAKDTAVRYTGRARRRLAPKVSSAAVRARRTARSQYGAHLGPMVAQAVEVMPPRVAATVEAAARQTRRRARQATRYAAPRVGQAVVAARTATEPVREEAAARSAAALTALRGQVTARQIEKLARRNARRARRGRFTRRLTAVGALLGGAAAAWLWWTRQTNPQWLVEPAAATGAASAGALDAAMDGSGDPVDARLRSVYPEREEPEGGI